MADLTGKKIKNTYKDLLQVSNGNSGVDATLRVVEDGQGTESALSISSAEIQVDNININGNAIISADTNGDITITPDGTGSIVLDGQSWPQADGTNGQAIVTDGAGQLSYSSITITALGDISDVTITSNTSGEILKWNGSAWINQTLAEAGIAATSHTHVEADITDLGAYITASSSDALTNKTGSNSQWTNDESYITASSSDALTNKTGSNSQWANDEGYITATLTNEEVEDIAGPLAATGGTKTGIAVTYQDVTGDMDFVVSDTTVAGDTGSTGMTPGDTLTVAGGTNVTTAMSGDTLTVNADAQTPEGTAILSTGEAGGSKFLREDGDGTCSWQAAAGSGDMVLNDVQTVTGAKTYGSAGAVGKLIVAGTTSGTTIIDATAVAGTTTVTLPAATDTLVGKATTDTLTNKTIDTASNTITVAEADISDLQTYATAASTTTFTNKTIDANGTGNSISNIDIADLANGTDGELITWDAAGAPAAVAAGTSTHVLTSNGAGAPPTFQAAGGGGGAWSFVSSTTASSSATIDFTDLSGAVYMLALDQVDPATSGARLYLRASDDNGTTFEALNYMYNGQGVSGSTEIIDNDQSATEIDLNLDTVGVTSAVGTYGLSGFIHLRVLGVTGSPMTIDATVVYQNGFGDLVTLWVGGMTSDDGNAGATTNVDAVRLYFSTGNISTGTVRLYKLTDS